MKGSESATALVDMPGFVVGARLEVDGEWWLHVETTADVMGCEACGTRAVGRGRRVVKVRDLPVAGRPVVLAWSKRIWRCAESDCVVVTWSEDADGVAPRAALTDRAREEICRRVGRDAHSVAEAARAFGVSWHTAMAAVRDHGTPRVDHPKGLLREVYGTRSEREARRRLQRFHRHCAGAGVAELTRLSKTVRSWEQ